jgi:hypothetical protein
MEEILASIRRIIADDEAKPPSADKAATPAAAPAPAPAKPEKRAAALAPVKPPVMADIPPSAIPAAVAAAAKAAAHEPPPATPPASAPAPVANNSQDDIDALLSGLDQATSPEEVRGPQPDMDVFELTDDMEVRAAPPPSSFHKIEPQDDIEFTESSTARSNHRRAAFEQPSFQSPTPAAQAMLSHSTVSAVESAFNALAHTVLSNNARTLEDLVKEMLRPMLKSWLDDNLPGLVERIVKAEIERVSRGR